MRVHLCTKLPWFCSTRLESLLTSVSFRLNDGLHGGAIYLYCRLRGACLRGPNWRSRDLFVFSQAESVGPEKAREEKRTRSCLSAPVEGGDGDGESRRRSP